jgi:hypothetical protein
MSAASLVTSARAPLEPPMPRVNLPVPTVPMRTPVASAGPPRPLARDLSLELDRSDPSFQKKETAAGPARGEFYPKQGRDWSRMSSSLARVATWVVVIGALIAGWQYYKLQEEKEAQAAADYKRAEDMRLLQDAMKDTGARCDGSSSDGWAYDDANGTTIVVESLSRVPKRFQKSARCVRLGGRR